MKNLKKILNSVLVVFLISTQFNFLFAQQNLPSKHIELGSEINVVDTQEKNYVEGEIIVKFRPAEINLKSSSSKNLLNTFEINNDLQSQDTITTDNIAVMKIENNQSVEQKLAELQSDPNVEYAQPNYIYHILSDDPLSGNLWGLPQIKWNEAMSIFSGTSSLVTGTIVAVIDMGVFYNHPDLINKMRDGSACKSDTGVSLSGCIHGYDYRDDDKDPSPIFNDHGTHVAGTIGAQMDNGIGIMGVNPQAQIMTIRAGEGGDLNSVTIIRGINFAKYNGAKIINASFGSTDYDTGTKTAIDNFPGLFIAAAGNAGSNNDTTQVYPCNYLSDNIICVAATDQSDDLSWFSNYGSQSVDLGAPGTYIHSTVYTTGISLLEGFTGSTLGEVPSGWTTGGTTNNRGVLNIGGSLGNVLFSDINLPYANNTNSSIEIGQDLSSYLGASLSFETICDTEYTDSRADYMSLEISADGITYTGLNLFMPYGANDNKRNEWTLDDNLDPNDNDILSGTYAELYSSIPSSYLTNSFKIRFKWITNGSDANNYNGCLVDNIKIEGHTSSYGDKQGTSMAAPHVAGLASLAWSASPSMTYNQIKNIIINNGDFLSALSGKTVSGKRINAQKTLEALNYVSVYSSVGQSLSGGGISNNLHTIINSAMSGDVNNFSGLYFAKMSGSTELGRITFATGLDLTDTGTQNFLSGDLATSIGISQGKIRFTPGSGFENKNARLQMNLPTSFSGIVGYINSSSFIVREGSGGAMTGNSMITSISTGSCTATYCPIYINVLHFTSFELKPQLIKVNIKSNNTKNTSYAKSGDIITLSFTGSETLASVSATINGFTGVVTGSTLSRYTTFTVTGGTANTGIVFSINYQNLGGATGNTVISTTDGSTVRVDTISPILTGAASVSNTGTQTPSYSFTSSEAGTISYASGCTSSTTTAVSGTNNITFSTMSNATYTGCRIYVSDNAANQPYIIVPTFTVNYVAGGGGGGGGGGDTDDDLPSCKLSDVVCVDGEYEIDGNVDCEGGYLGDSCEEEEDEVVEDTSIDEGDISDSPFNTALNDAYQYAYKIGITTMPTIHKANMTGTLQRSHLAKMIVNYATQVLDAQVDTGKTCNFSDISDQTTELRGYIKTACQMGLMGVGLKTFYPKNKVTRAEFGTILSRALRGNDNNQSGRDYYSKHLQALKYAGIMTQISTPSDIEIRGYVMLMLMRAEDKQ